MPGDSRARVLRTKSEAFHNDCLVKKVKHPASLMVWGCMSSAGVGRLYFVEGIVNAKKYIDILQNQLLPSLNEMQSPHNEVIFQQDGAPCHTAKKVKAWLASNDIPLLDWTSSSPDLSPIETLWNEMKKKLRSRPARTIGELRQRLQGIWDSFTPADCQRLVDTMPRRIQAVLTNKGDVTQW